MSIYIRRRITLCLEETIYIENKEITLPPENKVKKKKLKAYSTEEVITGKIVNLFL